VSNALAALTVASVVVAVTVILRLVNLGRTRPIDWRREAPVLIAGGGVVVSLALIVVAGDVAIRLVVPTVITLVGVLLLAYQRSWNGARITSPAIGWIAIVVGVIGLVLVALKS
jgi:hypothetical protein